MSQYSDLFLCLWPILANFKNSNLHMKRNTILYISQVLVTSLFLACQKPSNTETPVPPVTEKPDPTPQVPSPEPPKETENYWKVDVSKRMNDISFEEKEVDGIMEYSFNCTGVDPYFYFETLKGADVSKESVLTFEYQSNSELASQLFFCTPGASEAKSTRKTFPASSSWKSVAVPVFFYALDFGWGSDGHSLRVDPCSKSGVTLKIRKVKLREPNASEKAVMDKEQKERDALKNRDAALTAYVNSSYAMSISSVAVTAEGVTIAGAASGDGVELVEITPWQDVTDASFAERQPVSGAFSVTVARTVEKDGYRYDRVQSRWALVKKGEGGTDKLVSAARYADVIPCASAAREVKIRDKKGLGGYFGNDVQTQDLTDLGISHVTINVTPNNFFFKNDPGNSISHEYCGKTYYVRKSSIESYDKLFTTCQEKGIVVSAIILIQRTAADYAVRADVVHPDCDGGNYAMPNFTTVAGVQTYGAMLDFLASRYSPADGTHGSIHNWIMHNEVDAANEWTNMGSKATENMMVHEYVKSMRLCHNIARQYYPYAHVMASLAHTWTKSDNATGFTSKSILEKIVKYSSMEGDFEWGLAAHPYPQSLLEPRIWSKDTRATYSMNSDFVTFKNLEVLDKWILAPANMYNGNVKRLLLLSENGTNAKSYDDADLTDQAAGAAWAMKKVYRLQGIDGIDWHNWYDHPDEVSQGLRIGLRNSALAAKPVWTVYQAAGTAKESEVFDPYLSVIGISSWDEIFNTAF